jgi:hypothetical protein
LDTDDLRDVDTFAGTQLAGQTDDRAADPDFRHGRQPAGVTMDTIFADMAAGRSLSYMNGWKK